MYNNGEYYQVTVARDGVNASLQVTPLKSESQYLSESKSVYIGVTSIPMVSLLCSVLFRLQGEL